MLFISRNLRSLLETGCESVLSFRLSLLWRGTLAVNIPGINHLGCNRPNIHYFSFIHRDPLSAQIAKVAGLIRDKQHKPLIPRVVSDYLCDDISCREWLLARFTGGREALHPLSVTAARQCRQSGTNPP